MGVLDAAGTSHLRAQIAELRDAGILDLQLDLSEVRSSGPMLPRALAWMQSQIGDAGGRLTIIGARDDLRNHLDIAAIDLNRPPA